MSPMVGVALMIGLLSLGFANFQTATLIAVGILTVTVVMQEREIENQQRTIDRLTSADKSEPAPDRAQLIEPVASGAPPSLPASPRLLAQRPANERNADL